MKTAEYGGDVGVSVSEQEERRTGAGMFIQSGTVGDDPLVFGEIEFCRIGFELSKLDVDRTRDMAGRECLFASYIDNDGCSIVEGSFGIFNSYPPNFIFGERYFIGWQILLSCW